MTLPGALWRHPPVSAQVAFGVQLGNSTQRLRHATPPLTLTKLLRHFRSFGHFHVHTQLHLLLLCIGAQDVRGWVPSERLSSNNVDDTTDDINTNGYSTLRYAYRTKWHNFY